MTLILVLIGNPARPAVGPEQVMHAERALERAGANVASTRWLADGIACEIGFSGIEGAEAVVRAALGDQEIDIAVVPAEGRRKRLLVADMESTIIENEMLDELAEFLGLREHIAAITARAMNGEIDFAGALRERVALLKGLPASRLDEAATRIRYVPGGAELVATMRANGATCALVSGGFTVFTALVRAHVGFDLDRANRLSIDGDTLAGTVAEPILGREAKLAALQELAQKQGLAVADAVTVGDGANDLPMLQAAGLGVAFRAKPAVAAATRVHIDHGDLTALLYLQGYRKAEFVGG